MCGVWYLAIGAGTLRSCVIPNKRTNNSKKGIADLALLATEQNASRAAVAVKVITVDSTGSPKLTRGTRSEQDASDPKTYTLTASDETVDLGTFLVIATVEVIPHEFAHDALDRVSKTIAILVAVLAMAMLAKAHVH